MHSSQCRLLEAQASDISLSSSLRTPLCARTWKEVCFPQGPHAYRKHFNHHVAEPKTTTGRRQARIRKIFGVKAFVRKIIDSTTITITSKDIALDFDVQSKSKAVYRWHHQSYDHVLVIVGPTKGRFCSSQLTTKSTICRPTSFWSITNLDCKGNCTCLVRLSQ